MKHLKNLLICLFILCLAFVVFCACSPKDDEEGESATDSSAPSETVTSETGASEPVDSDTVVSAEETSGVEENTSKMPNGLSASWVTGSDTNWSSDYPYPGQTEEATQNS